MVAAVIEAVSGGQADIGFIAYEPSRAATVDFSQTYMLVQQSFLGARQFADPRDRRRGPRRDARSPAPAPIRSRFS